MPEEGRKGGLKYAKRNNSLYIYYCINNCWKCCNTKLYSWVESLADQLSDLKSDIFKEEENIERDSIKDKIKQIEDNWESRHDKLAYYIEHDELEKVETNLTSLRSFIEANENSEAVSELDKSVFVLKHIEDKYAFNLQNIF